MAITLLAAAAVIIVLTRLFVRPIEKLASSARHVAEGDFTQRVPVTTTDEIGTLAESFNQMTAQLENMVDTLEQRVADRTSELEAKNSEMALVQQQLEELMRSKDEFLGSVSHELRTPLTSVLGFSNMLRDRYAEMDDAERQEFIARVSHQGQEMANIIEDLLVAARADMPNVAIEPSAIDITEDVESVLEHHPGVVTGLKVPSGPAAALADPVRVRQILRNLVQNAQRYGGPDVRLSVELRDDCVVVQVRDNGEGIPEDDWELVFDPYSRSHHRRGQPASVGLGLTVSRMLARRMDGDLTYRYENGQSVFELLVPNTEDHAIAEEAATLDPVG
jgi:signal transduction histidine kinase